MNNNSLGVSIIIPIYNTAETLEKCIGSVQMQSHTNIEIILVDDGSDDGSGNICDELSKMDSRISVIHQENKGQTKARTVGVGFAGCNYIAFVDSDDYVEKDYIENLLDGLVDEKVDLVVTNLLYEREASVVRNNAFLDNGVFDKQEIIGSLISNEVDGDSSFPVSMCGKLFIKDHLLECLQEMNLKFSYGEDLVTLLFYINKIKRISVSNAWGYHYVLRKGSTTSNLSLRAFTDIKLLQDFIYNNCDNNDIIQQSDCFLRFMLMETIESVYRNIDMGYISYIPPYEIIPKGSRLAVYGAGKVGKSMVKCLLHSKYADIAGWFDEKISEEIYGLKISRPELIKECQFDYVLIAVSIDDYVKQIKDNLFNLGVTEDSVLWKKPYCG